MLNMIFSGENQPRLIESCLKVWCDALPAPVHCGELNCMYKQEKKSAEDMCPLRLWFAIHGSFHAQIALLHHVVFLQIICRILQDDLPSLNNIATISN